MRCWLRISIPFITTMIIKIWANLRFYRFCHQHVNLLRLCSVTPGSWSHLGTIGRWVWIPLGRNQRGSDTKLRLKLLQLVIEGFAQLYLAMITLCSQNVIRSTVASWSPQRLSSVFLDSITAWWVLMIKSRRLAPLYPQEVAGAVQNYLTKRLTRNLGNCFQAFGHCQLTNWEYRLRWWPGIGKEP